MFVENSMRGAFLLAFRAHRQQSRALLDYDDVVVEINDFQAVTLDRCGGDLFARRNSHNVARLQLCIVPDSSYSRDGHRAEAQKILGRFARESERQGEQERQQFASRRDAKLVVTRGHCGNMVAHYR